MILLSLKMYAESLSVVGLDADYDDVEEILRQFDMNMAYGPCLGLSRVERWERAHRIGLNPPQYVKNVLQDAGGNPDCLWEGRV